MSLNVSSFSLPNSFTLIVKSFSLSFCFEKSKEKYTIGDRVIVRVVRASKEDKTIDFEIVKRV